MQSVNEKSVREDLNFFERKLDASPREEFSGYSQASSYMEVSTEVSFYEEVYEAGPENKKQQLDELLKQVSKCFRPFFATESIKKIIQNELRQKNIDVSVLSDFNLNTMVVLNSLDKGNHVIYKSQQDILDMMGFCNLRRYMVDRFNVSPHVIYKFNIAVFVDNMPNAIKYATFLWHLKIFQELEMSFYSWIFVLRHKFN